MFKKFRFFFSALGSIFNLCPPPNVSSYIKDDEEAIRSDWEAVGNDLRSAMQAEQINSAYNEIVNEWKENNRKNNTNYSLHEYLDNKK